MEIWQPPRSPAGQRMMPQAWPDRGSIIHPLASAILSAASIAFFVPGPHSHSVRDALTYANTTPTGARGATDDQSLKRPSSADWQSDAGGAWSIYSMERAVWILGRPCAQLALGTSTARLRDASGTPRQRLVWTMEACQATVRL